MASKKTLNAKNLEALGAERLAELLIEISRGNAVAQRRLRLELAGAASPADMVQEIRKRLTAFARSRSFVNWQQRKALVVDLETQKQAIAQVATVDAAEALDPLWRFRALAHPIFGRCDDSSGNVIAVFQAACRDLGDTANLANAAPNVLAEQAYRALIENEYGQYDGLIEVLAPALGPTGLDHLKQLILKLSQESRQKPRAEERKVVGWGMVGPLYADELAERHRSSMVRMALEAIADAQGDVDAFIAQQGEKPRRVPSVAVEIAQRLLAAGRTEEAWSAINAVDQDRPGWIPVEWEQTRIKVLEALGRADEVQAFRWACFERSLNPEHLRSYLKRLPDFDDLEAEERAIAHARSHPSVHQALSFLMTWPALDQAAHLALTRVDELNGDFYEILAPAAAALEAKYPLAATVLRRALIDFALERNRTQRYQHAARHLEECENLADQIEDFDRFEAHNVYVRRLKTQHGRKSSFWSLVV
ncbi:hypothetical protein BB934_32615 (plasmid) [Microvirga ossetica]|uniref:Uncharacterized protein n=1 Tax=Microvirga ossetica TaxID=1882682 RepID=A0A1B2ESL5_9HYPH|nr:DUF6880 family protein [Microvirga ossetica]ANY82964.1 hypothetical protein BB934_32615 [Microvirga ossetica]